MSHVISQALQGRHPPAPQQPRSRGSISPDSRFTNEQFITKTAHHF